MMCELMQNNALVAHAGSIYGSACMQESLCVVKDKQRDVHAYM